MKTKFRKKNNFKSHSMFYLSISLFKIFFQQNARFKKFLTYKNLKNFYPKIFKKLPQFFYKQSRSNKYISIGNNSDFISTACVRHAFPSCVLTVYHFVILFMDHALRLAILLLRFQFKSISHLEEFITVVIS